MAAFEQNLNQRQNALQKPKQETTLRQTQTLSEHQQFGIRLLQKPITQLSAVIEEKIADYPLIQPVSNMDVLDAPAMPWDETSSDSDEYLEMSRIGEIADLDTHRNQDNDDEGYQVAENQDEEYDSEHENDENESWDADDLSRIDDFDPDKKYSEEENDEINSSRDFFFDSIEQSQSVYQQLDEQLQQESSSPEIKKAAQIIIGNLDEHGILTSTMEEIAEAADCSIDTAEKAKLLVQSFEPAGLAAASIQESLLLQLERNGITDGLPVELLRNHYQDFIKAKHQDIIKAMDISADELNNAVLVIRKNTTLDPLKSIRAEQITDCTPEVSLVQAENGDFIVVPNHDAMPVYYIDEEYEQYLQDEQYPDEAKNYVRENFNTLREINGLLQDRERTITRIAKILANEQHDFIESGEECLRPLKLKDIADKLNLDESTISRAVKDKYIATPRGILRFEEFFSNGYSTLNGDFSADAVSEKIRKMIQDEDPFSPLSDQKLTAMLQAEGIGIERRTVAKYREKMGFLNSSRRKHSL